MCSGGLHLVAPSATAAQTNFEGEQNQDLNQKSIAELTHGQKRDTIRRDYAESISFRVYSSPVPLLAIHTPVKPNGQTANRAASRPLHQEISLYLI